MSFPNLSDVSGWLKQPVWVLAGIALASGVALFAPDTWTNAAELTEARDRFRPWIAAVFLVAASLALANLMRAPVLACGEAIGSWKERRRGKRRLHSLVPREQELLSTYIERRSKTVSHTHVSGHVRELEEAGILWQASGPGTETGGRHYVYNISTWAWDYLQENPSLLERRLKGPPDDGESSSPWWKFWD